MIDPLRDIVQFAPVRTCRYGSVNVELFDPDHNDWAWSTLRNIGVPYESPGRDEDIEAAFRIIMTNVPRDVTYFAVPATVVTTESATDVFFRWADRAQQRWLREARQVLGGSRRMQLAMRRLSPIIRQLSFTGVMVVNGRHLLPGTWLQP